MKLKLRVTTTQDGLRRGGVIHHGTQIHVIQGHTAAQILQMIDEPKLQVDLVEEDEAGSIVIRPWPADRKRLEEGLADLVALANGKAAKAEDAPASDTVAARLSDLEEAFDQLDKLAKTVKRLESDVGSRDQRIAELEKQLAEAVKAGKAGKKDETQKT